MTAKAKEAQKVVVVGHEYPEDAKRKERPAPFKAHKGGVRAAGTVSEVRKPYDGGSKRVRITVKHGAAASGIDDGDETTFHVPPHLAKRFPFGKKVAVHVVPYGGMTAAPGDEEDDPDGGDSEVAEVPNIRTAMEKVRSKRSKA